jgi:hypothetical protein
MRVNRALIGEKVLTVNGQHTALTDISRRFAQKRSLPDSGNHGVKQDSTRRAEEGDHHAFRAGCASLWSLWRLYVVLQSCREASLRLRNWQESNFSVSCLVNPGRLVEALTVRAIIYGHTAKILSGGAEVESLEPMIEDRKVALASVQEKITRATTAITLGGNIASLVEILLALEG